MFSKKEVINIAGDYQYAALTKGIRAQRYWHQKKLELVEKYLEANKYRRICEAGCGSGIVAHHIAKLLPSAEVIGIDKNEQAVKFAAGKFDMVSNLKFYKRNLLNEKDAFPPFDLIVSTEVIEHFTEQEVKSYLRTLRRYGSEETIYILTTPDYNTLWPVIEMLSDLLAIAHKMRNVQHLTKFNKDMLYDLLRRERFAIIDMYNFCGWAPLIAQFSIRLSDIMEKYEKARQKGFLICCVFRIAKDAR